MCIRDRYITVYYIGGGLGAVLPAAVWTRGGWPATVAMVLGVQAFAAALAALFWTRRGPRSVDPAIESIAA